jgi:hypothetical protein
LKGQIHAPLGNLVGCLLSTLAHALELALMARLYFLLGHCQT